VLEDDLICMNVSLQILPEARAAQGAGLMTLERHKYLRLVAYLRVLPKSQYTPYIRILAFGQYTPRHVSCCWGMAAAVTQPTQCRFRAVFSC
jgi:hypothetical protein